MIVVADLQTAIATPGAVMIEASNPPKVYFAGDTLPSWCLVVNQPIDLSELNSASSKDLKTAVLLLRQYCNWLKAETRGLAVLLVQKGTITAAEANALLSYDGSGAGDSKTVADLKADYKAAWISISGAL